MGTCRAEVTGYDSKTKLWTVTYEADGVSEEFDYEDMNKYVIDRICGTAPADGGAALSGWLADISSPRAGGLPYQPTNRNLYTDGNITSPAV